MNFQVIKNSKFVLVLFTSLLYLNVNAQCAICRASLQNDSNQPTAQSINDGIVYLMAIPYILVAAAAYAVYKIKFHKKKEEL